MVEIEKNWVKKYTLALFFYIHQKVDDKEEAWDLTQETLISASQSLPLYAGKSSFSAWLYGIARHEVVDFYRKKKIKTVLFSHMPFLEELADQAFGPEEEIIEKELKMRVKEVLANLSEGYSIILRLKYIDGESVGQIAQELGLSYKTVESRLTRARIAFQKAWIGENANIKYQISKLQIKKQKYSSET
jgi:RNA polymerase sigma-70 factor (ECF subfamily)